MNSKVSVVMPVYNADKFVGKSIESVLNQSWDNVELILVNDGSTDNSGKVCDEYKERNPQIQVRHQKNSGPGKAKNEGLNIATGEYVVFLDCDDVLENDAILNLMNKEQETRADMVMPDRYYVIDEYDNLVGTKFHFNKDLMIQEPVKFAVEVMMGAGRGWRSHSLLFKKESLDKYNIRFIDRSMVDDYFFNMECMKHFEKLAYIQKATVYYRVRKNSITSSFHENFMDMIWKFDSAAEEFLQEKKVDREYADKYQNVVVVRTVITYIVDIFSRKTSMKWRERTARAKKIIDDQKVQKKFHGNIADIFFTSKITVYFFKIMHYLIRLRLHVVTYLFAYLAGRRK